MAVTRIFVKNLPPSASEDDFRAHFAKRYTVTDSKLLQHRRIGYVGLKNAEDAAAAVKYFDRSFMRMSRIGVELVDPAKSKIAEVAAPVRKARDIPSERTATQPDTANPLKRKRPSSQDIEGVTKSRDANHVRNIDSGPDDVNDKEAVESEVDNGQTEQSQPLSSIEKSDEGTKLPVATDLSDQDWIRSRTSRLLGLIDDDEEEKDRPPVSTASDVPPNDKRSKTHNTAPEDAPQQPTPPPEQDLQISISKADAAAEQSDDLIDPQIEEVRASRRLFIRNLPYSVQEEDLAELFEGYGTIQEILVPVDAKTDQPKGLAFVLFGNADKAVEAIQSLDGTIFQGRLLHILPAAAKRDAQLDEVAMSKLPVKKQRQIQRKAEASSTTFNWNSLYMNTDAVITSVSQRLGVSKSELIDPTSSDAAVKQAQAETHVIQETKQFFEQHGVDLNAFGNRLRGDTVILVKNFPYGTTPDELKVLFAQHGDIAKLIMPPSGTIAIVQFKHAPEARSAFASLAYRKFKESVLFLEKAPKDIFKISATGDQAIGQAPSDAKADQNANADGDLEPGSTTTLFVRNLNFSTTNQRLFEAFKPLDGLISARVKTKTDAKRPGEVLSMGFGFLEFKSSDQAQAALTAMDGYELDGHKLLIRASHKGNDAAQERRKADNERKKKAKTSKLVIKNLPFETSKKDVRELLKTYGQLRAVRVPKKFDTSRKGYAFAEFTTAREAESAMESLRNTHLLGRRLVLEFASGESEDPETEIERMQQKVGKQTNSVALRKLTATSERKKFLADQHEEGD